MTIESRPDRRRQAPADTFGTGPWLVGAALKPLVRGGTTMTKKTRTPAAEITVAPAPTRITKSATIIQLLGRDEGATRARRSRS